MINFDDVQKKHKKHNPSWPQIRDLQKRILIIGGSGSVKNKFII